MSELYSQIAMLVTEPNREYNYNKKLYWNALEKRVYIESIGGVEKYIEGLPLDPYYYKYNKTEEQVNSSMYDKDFKCDCSTCRLVKGLPIL